jgi:hypothetical protein
MLKHLIESGNLSSRRKYESESMYTEKKLLKHFEIFWKKLLIKLKSSVRNILYGEKERDNQPNDWKSWLSDVIVEVFVVGKPELPQNFSTSGAGAV